MSVLPVKKSTLRYGSADAGVTVHFDDPVLFEVFNTLFIGIAKQNSMIWFI